MVIGVLQLSNKTAPITPLDIRNFEFILDTLGRIFHTNQDSSFGIKLFENFKRDVEITKRELESGLQLFEDNQEAFKEMKI